MARRSRSYLVAEVLDLTGAYDKLAHLQRQVLVPLELEFAAWPDVAGWEPPQWVASVEAALSRHRGRTEAQ